MTQTPTPNPQSPPSAPLWYQRSAFHYGALAALVIIAGVTYLGVRSSSTQNAWSPNKAVYCSATFTGVSTPTASTPADVLQSATLFQKLANAAPTKALSTELSADATLLRTIAKDPAHIKGIIDGSYTSPLTTQYGNINNNLSGAFLTSLVKECPASVVHEGNQKSVDIMAAIAAADAEYYASVANNTSITAAGLAAQSGVQHGVSVTLAPSGGGYVLL
jgi:hypothetical protein